MLNLAQFTRVETLEFQIFLDHINISTKGVALIIKLGNKIKTNTMIQLSNATSFTV